MVDLWVTGWLQILATCIDKLDITLRLEREQYEQLMRNVWDNYMKRIKNIQVTGATDEHVAVTTTVDEHMTAMTASASTQETLKVAWELAIAQHANTRGMLIARD